MSEEKQIVTGDYIDSKTGIRFVEDIRGNFHCCFMEMSMPNINIPESKIDVNVPQQPPPNVIVQAPEIKIDFCEEKDKSIKRLEGILERMRSENLHLWEIINTAIQMRTKNKNGDKLAMDYIEKAIKNLNAEE